jgi:hypothetical protein
LLQVRDVSTRALDGDSRGALLSDGAGIEPAHSIGNEIGSLGTVPSLSEVGLRLAQQIRQPLRTLAAYAVRVLVEDAWATSFLSCHARQPTRKRGAPTQAPLPLDRSGKPTLSARARPMVLREHRDKARVRTQARIVQVLLQRRPGALGLVDHRARITDRSVGAVLAAEPVLERRHRLGLGDHLALRPGHSA